MSANEPPSSRELEYTAVGQATSDGAGVKLTRVLTSKWQRRLDPFLMLDEFRTDSADDYIAGFPDHPHRGFETVTYMLAGRMRHKDSVGNEGLLKSGDVQWMSAGRGIIHSEMPEQEQGLMQGFQLWLNLPAKNKMMMPLYQDLSSANIPELKLADGSLVRIIAGHFNNNAGAVQRPDTEPLYFDLHLAAESEVIVAVPPGHNTFVYPYDGQINIGVDDKSLLQQQMGILSNNGATSVRLRATTPVKLLLIAGKPLGEPIVQYGPFVMNTQAEIEKAFRDFHGGKFLG